MSVPVASFNCPPITDAGRAANHQGVKAPSASTFTPSHFTPVPVASALKGSITGTAYSETITAQGGTPAYSFAVTSGALPTGTTMTSGGVISGTPSAASTFTFTVTVTDSLGFTGSQSFTVVVAAPAVASAASYIVVN